MSQINHDIAQSLVQSRMNINPVNIHGNYAIKGYRGSTENAIGGT